MTNAQQWSVMTFENKLFESFKTTHGVIFSPDRQHHPMEQALFLS